MLSQDRAKFASERPPNVILRNAMFTGDTFDRTGYIADADRWSVTTPSDRITDWRGRCKKECAHVDARAEQSFERDGGEGAAPPEKRNGDAGLNVETRFV